MISIISAILFLILAIASGIYSYYSGNVAAETVCVFSVLGLGISLFVAAFGSPIGIEKGDE